MIYAVIWRGFRFGALLQAAVGPVCLYIFQTAAISGFFTAEAAVLGVTLADSLFVGAALFGIGSIIEKNSSARSIFRYVGAAVIILFGISSISGAFGLSILPGLGGIRKTSSDSAFINALLLTISSPLTIVFWAGVFSAKTASGEMERNEVSYFAFGAILSTLIFMSVTAAAGVLTGNFMSGTVILGLNLVVGAALVLIGIRTAFRK